MFDVGERVSTEFGSGVVAESSARRVFIRLDNDETINVATGTPGYSRIRAEWTHDPSRDGSGCTWCGAYAQVDSDNLCRECHDEA